MSETTPPPSEHEPASLAGAVPPPPPDGQTAEYPTLAGGLALPLAPLADDAPLDADGDEEWVPRTSHGIRLAIPFAALVAVLLLAGGFWGGVELEKSHGSGSGGASLASIASRFRSGARSTSRGSSTTGSSGLRSLFGGSSAAAAGTISVVDGNTLYVLTATGSLVKVTLSKSTTITRNASAQSVDLRPGDTVTVQGSTASNGNVTATSVSAPAPGVTSTSGLGGFAGSGTSTTTSTTSG